MMSEKNWAHQTGQAVPRPGRPAWMLAAAAVAAASVLSLTACAGRTPAPAGQPSAPAPAPAASAPAPAPAAGTRVVSYAPWTSAGTLASGISADATVSGSCFTSSSATTDPGAFRCTSGNFLYDPCFAPAASGSSRVACPSPGDPGSVTVITLPGPLPAPGSGGSSPTPWLLLLANGQQCETITGTGTILGGRPEDFGCTSGGVYGQPDTSNGVWTVPYAPSGTPASSITKVAVATAYV